MERQSQLTVEPSTTVDIIDPLEDSVGPSERGNNQTALEGRELVQLIATHISRFTSHTTGYQVPLYLRICQCSGGYRNSRGWSTAQRIVREAIRN